MNTPRVLVEWTMLNDGNNHFSYEDMGSLRLNCWLLVLQIALCAMVIKSWCTSIKENERYFSPHLVMLLSLMAQVTAQFL